MEARFDAIRNTTLPMLLLFVLVVALLLGGAIGYMVRPPSFVSGPTHYVVAPDTNPNSDSCLFVADHKAC